ncbi:MAG: ABC transporter permease, partial [Mesorhizobium sp.]
MNTQSPLPAPGAPLQHYVSIAPFDLQSVEAMTPEQSKVFQASQLRLMWWKFRRHRLALVSGIFLAVLYFAILICEFLAPYNLHTRNMDYIYAPPQRVHLFHNGQFVGPFVYGRQMTLDMDTLKRNYIDQQDDVQRIRFFCKGDSYRFWGLIEGDRHFVCPAENGQLFLAGTDRLGRDVLSRIIYGARISLTIGLVGISFSFLLGIVIG